MSDLTEQWKKGELPSGWYYTKLWKGCNVIDYFIGNQFLRYDDSDIDEVLAPVPSYDEWKQLKERVSKLEKMQYSYTPEEWNTMLRTVNRTKELLKECKEVFDECFSPSAKHGELYKKIDEVLK